jgi:hypothetical protein
MGKSKGDEQHQAKTSLNILLNFTAEALNRQQTSPFKNVNQMRPVNRALFYFLFMRLATFLMRFFVLQNYNCDK